MTATELKSTGEALIAASEGRTIQFLRNEGWFDVNYPNETLSGLKGYSLPPGTILRIKPTPAKRLIRAEEMGPVIWMRQKEWAKSQFKLVIEVQLNPACFVLCYGSEKKTVHERDLPNNWQWSPDRIQIRSFWVEGLE